MRQLAVVDLFAEPGHCSILVRRLLQTAEPRIDTRASSQQASAVESAQ
jgi:hypothetical protein